MAEDLREFEEWLEHIRGGLSPARRRTLSLRTAQVLRRANLKRIAANVEPDGDAMAPRKASRNERGRIRRKAGSRMFRRLRLARSWKIDADADGFEITPASASIDRVAAVHHFGETGRVGLLRSGRMIRAKYEARALLGFAQEDRETIFEATAELLESDHAFQNS